MQHPLFKEGEEEVCICVILNITHNQFFFYKKSKIIPKATKLGFKSFIWAVVTAAQFNMVENAKFFQKSFI